MNDPAFGWTKLDDGLRWTRRDWFILRQDRMGINSALWRVGRKNAGITEWLRNKSGSVRSFRHVSTAIVAANMWMCKDGWTYEQIDHIDL